MNHRRFARSFSIGAWGRCNTFGSWRARQKGQGRRIDRRPFSFACYRFRFKAGGFESSEARTLAARIQAIDELVGRPDGQRGVRECTRDRTGLGTICAVNVFEVARAVDRTRSVSRTIVNVVLNGRIGCATRVVVVVDAIRAACGSAAEAMRQIASRVAGALNHALQQGQTDYVAAIVLSRGNRRSTEGGRIGSRQGLLGLDGERLHFRHDAASEAVRNILLALRTSVSRHAQILRAARLRAGSACRAVRS